VNSSNPLDNFPIIRSRDIEEVCEALGRIYAKPAFAPTDRAAGINATINNCQLRHIALAYSTYGGGVALEYPATGLFVQLFPIRGTSGIICGPASSPLKPGSIAVVGPGMPYTMNYSADYAHLVLRIDAEALTKKIGSMTGAAIHEPLRMHTQQDLSHPAARMLQQYLPLLIKTLGEADPPYPDWWVMQIEELLMTLFLCGHRHNYSHLLEEEAPDAALRPVRQAEEYIEAHARRAITMNELAAVTGVSEFSLFRSFKNSRGYSPLEFAARQRGKLGRV
jgi:AraC-binding-like domain